MKETIEKGALVSLIDKNNYIYLIDTKHKTDHFKGVGVLNPSDLIGKEYGSIFTVNTKEFYLLKPTLMDKFKALKRKAQIIIPKDAANIILHCDITPGKTILEAGVGSGGLTTILASMIQPDGMVISYDLRSDFINHAQKNIDNAKLHDFVTIKEKDVTKAIDETNLHAIILDIPNPWDAVKHAWNALETGGTLCTYSPLISQVENTIKTMKQYSFIDIKTFETLYREMIVKEQGTRPSFDMLGHTGYLTFARKVTSELL
ncbi:MAG: tRNA (adenine-N1)-methyltransferase [Thermoplasmata archaeon]|nr:MAG: tRNA (adenine-N1)-methyltransferase [Thermoplasmata archaeon]